MTDILLAGGSLDGEIVHDYQGSDLFRVAETPPASWDRPSFRIRPLDTFVKIFVYQREGNSATFRYLRTEK